MNTHPWQVSPAQLVDAVPLAKIATAVFRQSPLQTPPAMKGAIQQANGRFWTLTHHRQPAGFALLLPLPGLPHLFELTGAVAPNFQRQGGGRFLWQQLLQNFRGTAVRQITHTVNNLDTPAAHFLTTHGFSVTHQEWKMSLTDLQTAVLPDPPAMACRLEAVGQETAVNTLPTLYERCFAGTPWFQPYSVDEVTATWEPTDQIYRLVADGKPIGFVWLHLPRPGLAEIEPLGIVKEKQEKGYGRFLLTKTLQTLKQQAVQTVMLGVWTTNKTAIHLYQSTGFRQTGSRFSLTYTLPAI